MSDWRLTMVDTNFEVPSDYAPEDLVSTSAAGLSSWFQVRSVMIPDLARMAAAASAAGAPLGIASAYRSYDTQVWTFWYWADLLGYDYALHSSARPGHSEHQLGLAIDFESAGGPDPWTYYNFARDTAAGAWLAANAWRYGFIMSYPLGSLARTCYGFEPWHYRYVGVAEAAAIHSSGLYLREWLWQHQPNPEPVGPVAPPSP
jgi:zinc D-Ala-D-Ala carboxypeptidase